MNTKHTMTGQDRKVLSGLLDKINAIHSMRDHKKYIYFLRKAIAEAEKRNAPHYRDRFKTMLVTARLSKRAFETRLTSRGITAVASCADWIIVRIALPALE